MQCSYIASLQGDMNVLLPSPSFQARVSGVVGDPTTSWDSVKANGPFGERHRMIDGDTDNQLGRGMPPD